MMPGATERRTNWATRDVFLRVVGFAVLYAVAAHGSLAFLVSPEGVAAIWPASGVFLAALLLSPRSQWWAVAGILGLIDFTAEITTGEIPLLPGAVFSLSLTLQAFVSAALIQHFRKRPLSFANLGDVYALLLWGCALTTAAFAIPPAAISHALMAGDFLAAWWWWSISGCLGVLVVCPLLMTWHHDPVATFKQMSLTRGTELAALLIAVGVVTWFAFTAENPSGTALTSYNYLPLPLLLVVVMRFKPNAVFLASSIFSAVVIVSGHNLVATGPTVVAMEAFLLIVLSSVFLFSAAVAEREGARVELSESEARFRGTFEQAAVGVAQVGVGGRWLRVNEKLCKIIGYEREELLALTFQDITHPDDLNTDLGYVREILDGTIPTYTMEKRYFRKDGSIVWVNLTVSLVRDAVGTPQYFIAVVEDITDRKQAEDALEKSQNRFARMFMDSPVPQAITAIEDGLFFDLNDRCESLTGYSREEIIGRTAGELGLWADISQRRSFVDQFRKDGYIHDFPMKMVTKSGDILDIVFDAQLIGSNERDQVLLVVRDVTERNRLEKRLRHANKMEAIGHLSAGLAHDFNNALGIISMNVELVKTMEADTPQTSKYFDAVTRGVRRATDLTRKMLDFARSEAGETRCVSANEFVQGMEGLVAKSLTPAIALKIVLANDTWSVEIDPGDLEDTILNLALNARDAMPDGGSLVIETANKAIDKDYVRLNPESFAGEFVVISVSDTGTGMTPEAVEKAFDPFFTTKEKGKGTGLGLSMVYGFAKRSGGYVNIYSELGQGTTIRLYLPRAQATREEDVSEVVNRKSLPGGNEVILVVDDEEELTSSAMSVLQRLGYKTFSATNGMMALEILKREQSIDLLFSDVIMPKGMDGYRLALEALALRPDLKVLLTSGFTRNREELVNGERKIANELAKDLLSKPYNIAELAVAVRRALDK